jgi:hypothetical protein
MPMSDKFKKDKIGGKKETGIYMTDEQVKK